MVKETFSIANQQYTIDNRLAKQTVKDIIIRVGKWIHEWEAAADTD